MKFIDVQTWNRKRHFEFFQSRVSPQYSVTFNVDITAFIHFYREKKCVDFSSAIYFAIMNAANSIVEFKMRLVDGAPVIFDAVDIAFTHMPSGQLLHCNCISKYSENYHIFQNNIRNSKEESEYNPTLTPEGGESQGLIYVSVLPHLTFTSVTNPWGDPNVDSVPRVIVGKYTDNDGKYNLPISVEVLHSFIDGVHITRFNDAVFEILNTPDSSLR